MQKAGLAVKIALFFIILFIFYKGYQYYIFKNEKNQPVSLVDKETLFHEKYTKTIPRIDLPESSVNLTLNWKMKIFNIPSNFLWHSSPKIDKPIFQNDGCPNVFYHPVDNILRIQFKILNAMSEVILTDIRIPDVPIQKWLMVSVVVRNRNINIYFGTELVRAIRLSNVPLMPKGHFQLGASDNNFMGKIKSANYYPYAMRPDEIEKLM